MPGISKDQQGPAAGVEQTSEKSHGLPGETGSSSELNVHQSQCQGAWPGLIYVCCA